MSASEAEGCGFDPRRVQVFFKSAAPALSRLFDELSEDERQDATVAVVIDFDRGVDAKLHRERFCGSVPAGDVERHILAGFDLITEAGDVKCLGI